MMPFFLRPYFLLLLLVPLFLRRFFVPKSDFERIVDKPFWLMFRVSLSDFYRYGHSALRVIAYVFFVTALSGPVFKEAPIETFSEKKGAVIVWETSAQNENLEIQRIAISDLLKQLDSVEAGFVVFDRYPYLIAPLSEDHQMIRQYLFQLAPSVMPAADSSDPGAARTFAEELLDRAGFSSGKIFFYDKDGFQSFGSFDSSFKSESGMMLYPIDYGIYFLVIGALVLVLSELIRRMAFLFCFLILFSPAIASAKYQNDWKGVEAYRDKDYRTAVSFFQKGDDADSLYNLGNAYAFADQIDQAIQTYEAVLERDPDHEDARFNLDYLRQQQPQNQQNQPQQTPQASQDGEQEDDQTQPPTMPEEPDETETEETDEPPPDESHNFINAPERGDQWLNRIPDEPLGLLKERLRRQYIKREGE